MKTKRVPRPNEWPVALSSDQVLEQLAAAVFALDLSGRFIQVNQAGSALVGYPSSRLIGLHFERLLPADLLPGIRDQFLRVAVHGERVVGYEATVLRKDGTPMDVGLTGAPLYRDGRIVAVVGVAEDISARKRVERQLARLQRARAALSACGHALARAGDEHELLREVCRIIVETGGYRSAWVGYAEPDVAQTVRPVASFGTEKGYLRAIKVTWADNHWGRGPAGAAIRAGTPCVVQDVFNDTRFVPWRKEARRRGFASVAALPLLADGRAIGTLAIYANEVGAFDAEEVSLLGELAADLSYGIAALRTRRALAESEERFRAVFEHASVGIAVIDNEGRFVEANARFCEMLGYSAAELLSKRFHDITHPDDLPGNLALRAARLTPGEERAYLLEKRYIRADGEIVWVNLTSSPIRDAAGRICRHIGVIEDITQRKAAERALEARTEDLNERVKELHCLYAVSRIIQELQIDSRGIPPSLFQRIVTVIPSALRLVEHAAARLVVGSRDFRTRAYRESPTAIRTAIHADGRAAGSLEICYVDPPAIAQDEPFLPEERELLQALAEQIGKLLERETASRVLKRERDLRERLIETSPAGIVMLDRDGRITLANAQAEKVLGLTRQEMMHRAYNAPEWRITDWAGRALPDAELPFQRAMRQGTPVYDVQHAIERPDGRRVLLSVNAAPVLEDGRIVAVIQTVEDVTERRQAIERLRASEERFRNLIESTTDWVWETDRHGVYTYVSPQVQGLLGYAPEEVLGRTPFELMPTDEGQRVRAAFADAVARCQPIVGLDNTNRRKDGRLVVLETNGVPFFDGAGELMGYRGVDRDITQRRQHEALLSDEKEILELIASNTPLERVLETIARAFERQAGARARCAIFLVRDGALQMVAAPGLPEGFRRLIEEQSNADPESPCAVAAARRQCVLTSARDADGAHANADRCRAHAAELGIRDATATPIISSDGAVLGVFAVYAGACCLNGHGQPELGERATRLARIALEKARTEERLAEMAYHDALTGLPNRALLRDRLRQAMIEARRQDRLLAVAYLDLDHFKRINDTLGHQVGDRLLVAVTERLSESLRAGDTVSRQGGDEFSLVLAGLAHVDDASRVARKIVDGFNRPFVIDGRELFVTASMGLTIFPFDDEDMEVLLKNADAAMYFAKEEGRNNFQFYSKKMNAESFERLVLENALRVALERDEFRLHYQPQIDSETGALIGAEALLRWQHPALGVVTPARFIPLAEETGLIVPIGEWVLRTACADAAAWQRAGHRVRVAVNLSWRQFRQVDLVDQVHAALREAALAPAYLELELTESLLMQDVEKTIAALRALKRQGVSISVDDFGTGYSSLSYLRRFPIDTIKIDKSFVDGIAVDEESLTIVRTIIAMAHSLGKHVIAEGVETAGQVAALQREGCRRMQGYRFGRPIPADELQRLLETRRFDESISDGGKAGSP